MGANVENYVYRVEEIDKLEQRNVRKKKISMIMNLFKQLKYSWIMVKCIKETLEQENSANCRNSL